MQLLTVGSFAAFLFPISDFLFLISDFFLPLAPKPYSLSPNPYSTIIKKGSRSIPDELQKTMVNLSACFFTFHGREGSPPGKTC